jgi:uncharacterized protein YndB with AHSA1/START domain
MERKEGVATISDESVRAKTGKTWGEWFQVLDEFGGKEKGHKAMAKHLSEAHGVGAWWAQSVTVQYERERGMREVNERPAGFGLSVSRTVAVPVEKAWDAWAEAAQLERWFTTGAKQDFREGGRYENADRDAGEFRRIVPHKRIRFTWEQPKHQPGSVVEVRFEAKNPEKTGIVLSHEKLSSKEEVEDLREGWTWAMDSLKSYLETGEPIRWEDWKARQGATAG